MALEEVPVKKVFIPSSQHVSRLSYDREGQPLEIRRLSGALVDELANCISLIADLDGARKGFSCLLSLIESSDDTEIDRIIFDGAAIRYRRCFTTGVRNIFKLKDFLGILNQEQRAFHDHIIDVTDKHVAHSVSDLEFQIIVAMIDTEESKEYYSGISAFSVSMASTSGDLLSVMIDCCEKFKREILEPRVHQIYEQLDHYLQQLSRDEIRKFPEPVIDTPFGRTGPLQKRK